MVSGSSSEDGTSSSDHHRSHFGCGVSANFHHFIVTALQTQVSRVSIGFRSSAVGSLIGSETLPIIICGLPTQERAALLRRPFPPHIPSHISLLPTNPFSHQ